jgi:subtilisin family serine protease
MPVAAPGNRYGRSEGTSNSAALVSGVAALMRARYPDMTAAEVVDRLTGTAVDRGANGRDNLYGHGQLDVIAALTAPRTPPKATPTAAATTDVPADGPPIVAEPIVERRGIPPFLIIGVGVLLLVLALAALMILRARRNR